jgi:hypothetical protein
VGVETQPGEIQGEGDAEVVFDIVDGLVFNALFDLGPMFQEEMAF